MFEFFFKLLGPNVAALLVLALNQMHWEGETLSLSAALANPVTAETRELVSHGYAFDIQYYVSIIINGRKTFRDTRRQVLTWNNGWLVNGVAIAPDSIQIAMGNANTTFSGLLFDEGDEIQVFIQASIAGDREFEVSTGLSTSILWKYFEPRLKVIYIFSNGQFHQQ
jgi:hypothetical protein